ncbi:MAG: N-acetylmuramoyl-L-alanine amidase [Nitrospira sp.]|nr:N-acetylmuramoyl-L-alanine amidase [Nitrospira sp.]
MRNCVSRLMSARALSLFLSCVILVFSVDVLLIQTAWAGTQDHRHPKLSPSSQKSRVKGKAASLAPITVKNLRAVSSSKKTRLVLDLDRQPEVTEHQADNPRRVIIALPNTSLSQTARTKATDGTVPSPLVVTQITPHAVAVSLPTTSFETYKQFTLSDPPRLVIDVMPSLEQSPISIEETKPTPPRTDPAGTQPTQPRAKSYTTIVIDPGHGGKDPGARGLRRTEEKDITLNVALRLKELLRKRPDVRVLMTRDRDVYLELEERAKFANSHGADLFVSIHVNSHPSRLVKGLEVYHFGEAKDQRALEVAARENGTPISSTGVGWEYLVADLLTTKKIEASLELAWNAKEAMVTQMNGPYDVTDHGVKTAPFYVLRFTSMPSILAEVAFISNPDEEALLRKPTFINDVARSLYQGILSFLANNK